MTWMTTSKASTNWDDATNYYDQEVPHGVDKAYNTSEYSYDGIYESENDYFTVSKATTTWS